MATIDPNALQQLIDQINTLRTEIETAGNEGRARLGGIKVNEAIARVPKGTDGKVNTGEWSAKSEDEKKEIHQGLVQVRDSLHEAADVDGPAEPGHIMSADYASNAAIVLWAVVGFLVTAGLLVGIVWRWGPATGTDFSTKVQGAIAALNNLEIAKDKATKADAEMAQAQRAPTGTGEEKNRAETQGGPESLAKKATDLHAEAEKAAQQVNLAAVEAVQAIRKGGANEGSVLLMVVLLGAFGGSLHLLRSLVKFVGNRQLRRSWLLYYLSTPVIGAGLASIVYMMLRIGLLGPSGGSTNGSAVSDLNLIAIYAFAALSGLFAETASEKLSEVFKTMFRTEERRAKDPLDAKHTPGTVVPVAVKQP